MACLEDYACHAEPVYRIEDDPDFQNSVGTPWEDTPEARVAMAWARPGDDADLEAMVMTHAARRAAPSRKAFRAAERAILKALAARKVRESLFQHGPVTVRFD